MLGETTPPRPGAASGSDAEALLVGPPIKNVAGTPPQTPWQARREKSPPVSGASDQGLLSGHTRDVAADPSTKGSRLDRGVWRAGLVPPGLVPGLLGLSVLLSLGLIAALFALASQHRGANETIRVPEGDFKPTGVTKPVPGAVGYNASSATVGNGHWCQIGMPKSDWNLTQRLQCKAAPQLRVKSLTYNLEWWKLFGQKKGNGGSAGRLIAESSRVEPYDLMAFQECNDVQRVLADAEHAGMVNSRGYRILGPLDPFTGAVALAWLDTKWKAMMFGITGVAEDAPSEWWGERYVAWVRLQHRQTGATLLCLNHHGPLPVHAPGGLCGPDATAFQLLRVIGYHAKPGDAVLLLGDFNANATSATVSRLAKHLEQAYEGKKYGGVDHFFTKCAEVAERHNLGRGGSDHEALSVVFKVR